MAERGRYRSRAAAGKRLTEDAPRLVNDEIGLPGRNGEVAAAVTHFGPHVELGGQVARCIESVLSGNEQALARAPFQPHERTAIAVPAGCVEPLVFGQAAR
jgi:hypothetical protein